MDDKLGPSADRVKSISEAVTRLDVNGDLDHNTKLTSLQPPVPTMPECKCGMPLCICEVSLPPAPAASVQVLQHFMILHLLFVHYNFLAKICYFAFHVL